MLGRLTTGDTPRASDGVFSVSEVSLAIAGLLTKNLDNISVEGEIVNLSRSPSGHVYFSLKDSKATLAAVIWKFNIPRIKVRLMIGMHVICSGSIKTFANASQYQLVVSGISVVNIQGAFLVRLEQLKQKLMQEGLFDERRKKPLPRIPRKIALITSMSGAVIKDMIHRIKARCPLHVLIAPVPVQGAESVMKIVRAIEILNSLRDDPPELLVLARGGGSPEDLAVFSSEEVVRAVARSRLPILSAIGHEVDFPLCDLAADRRAPTPSSAIEIALPLKSDLYGYLARLMSKIGQNVATRIKISESEVNAHAASRAAFVGRLDRAMVNIREKVLRAGHVLAMRLQQVQAKLVPYPVDKLDRAFQDVESRLSIFSARLRCLDPELLKSSGQPQVRTTKNVPVKSALVARSHKDLVLHFQDGSVEVSVKTKILPTAQDAYLGG